MGKNLERDVSRSVTQSTTQPLVSVVMAVCNGESWFHQALESIAGQTFSDYECIIIDDGSTDGTLQIALSFADDRVRVIENGSNLGLAASLNRGLRLARGRYIVRMDVDDVCIPTRFERQVVFMEANPLIAAAGCWVETISACNDIWKYPLDHEFIRCELLFGSSLAHPGMILRRDLFLEANLWYDESFRFAQDYDLWERASKQLRFANQPEILLQYRIHDNQVQNKEAESQLYFADLVRERQLKALFLSLNEEDLQFHLHVVRNRVMHSSAELVAAGKWFALLGEANEINGVYDAKAFRQTLARRWAAICIRATHLGLSTWRTFRHYATRSDIGMTRLERGMFLLKCCGRLR